jgi:chemotaxis protein histidine kinase CheA
MQERLNQSALFRQIAASKHGVVAPIEREILGDDPTEEEFQETSQSSGIPIEEVRRREELARREAMIEVREEVLRQTREKMDAAASEPAATEPEPSEEPVLEHTVTEEEANLREELARREAELEIQEEELRLCQEAAEIRERADNEAVRNREEADAVRRDEQAKEDALRAERDRQRRDAEAERYAAQAEEERRRQLQAEEENQRRALAEAQQRADAAAARLAAAQQRKHDQHMEEIARQENEAERHRRELEEDKKDDRPSLDPRLEQWDDEKSWFQKHEGAVVGSGIGGTILGLLMSLAIMWWNGFWDAPIVDLPADPPAVVTQEPPMPLVSSDADTLLLLQSRGLASPQTPLGEKILEAFEANPDLRVEVMQRVEDTLLGKEQIDTPIIPAGDPEP